MIPLFAVNTLIKTYVRWCQFPNGKVKISLTISLYGTLGAWVRHALEQFFYRLWLKFKTRNQTTTLTKIYLNNWKTVYAVKITNRAREPMKCIMTIEIEPQPSINTIDSSLHIASFIYVAFTIIAKLSRA